MNLKSVNKKQDCMNNESIVYFYYYIADYEGNWNGIQEFAN